MDSRGASMYALNYYCYMHDSALTLDDAPVLLNALGTLKIWCVVSSDIVNTPHL